MTTDMIPQEVIDAIKRGVSLNREVIVKKERGRWVVIENNRHVIYKEP